jgi:hypothetical protein
VLNCGGGRCIGYTVVMVVGDRGCGNLAGVVDECFSLVEVVGWVGVEVQLPLIRQWVLSLLLSAEDANGVLQFC